MSAKRILTLFYVQLFVFLGTGIVSLTQPGSKWIVLPLAGLIFLSIASATIYLREVRDLGQRIKEVLGEKSKITARGITLDVKSDLLKIMKKQKQTVHYIQQLGNRTKIENMDILIKDDPIGKAIIEVQNQMEQIKSEEDQRNWVNQGITKFSELLRVKDELKEFSVRIVSNLVKYTGANQGGFFIEFEDHQGRYLELTGCYAYEKKKYDQKRIYPGDGILGQCMFEKDLIFMTVVPSDYVKITSGLGFATPRNITIVPLLVNEKFYGAIELASFEIFPPHKLEFLKKVAASIAAEISSIRSLESTGKLLAESKALTEELRSHEEELKQNLEELSATQEQMNEKQLELDGLFKGINNTIACVEFNEEGQFVNGNDIFLTVTGYKNQELKGKNYQSLMHDDPSMQVMWNNLMQGKFFSGEFKIKDKAGKSLWVSGTFNPMQDQYGNLSKIMMFAQFTTQEKERLGSLNAFAVALKSSLPVIELSNTFECRTASEKFLTLFELTRSTIRQKKLNDFIEKSFQTYFNDLKVEILKKEFTSLFFPFIKGGETIWYESSITVCRSLNGEVNRVILALVQPVKEPQKVSSIVLN